MHWEFLTDRLSPSPAAEQIAIFLKSSNYNFKYMGIEALSRVVRINASFATDHQLSVIDCLEDPDETLKGKTLELLFKMTYPNNIEVNISQLNRYPRLRLIIVHG